MTTLQVHSFGLIFVSHLFQLYSSAMEKTGAVTRFKTGAFTRQGVRPSSQYWIALTHSAHCIYFGVKNGVSVFLYLAVDWMDHCCEFKTEWDVLHSEFQTKESSRFLDLMLTSFHAFMTDSFELDLIPCCHFYLVMERMLQ